jgi:uncharacterized protein
MRLSDKEIETLKSFFSNQPVLKAYLFGSYSRNEALSDSDFGFAGIRQNLEKILNRKVDLVPTEAVSAHILPFIEKDKMLIYERGHR